MKSKVDLAKESLARFKTMETRELTEVFSQEIGEPLAEYLFRVGQDCWDQGTDKERRQRLLAGLAIGYLIRVFEEKARKKATQQQALA